MQGQAAPAPTPKPASPEKPVLAITGNGVTPPASERESSRDMARTEAREYYRNAARPKPSPGGHLKYHIDRADYIPDCDQVWVQIRVNGMDSGQLRLYLSRGWVPARA